MASSNRILTKMKLCLDPHRQDGTWWGKRWFEARMERCGWDRGTHIRKHSARNCKIVDELDRILFLDRCMENCLFLWLIWVRDWVEFIWWALSHCLLRLTFDVCIVISYDTSCKFRFSQGRIDVSIFSYAFLKCYTLLLSKPVLPFSLVLPLWSIALSIISSGMLDIHHCIIGAGMIQHALNVYHSQSNRDCRHCNFALVPMSTRKLMAGRMRGCISLKLISWKKL